MVRYFPKNTRVRTFLLGEILQAASLSDELAHLFGFSDVSGLRKCRNAWREKNFLKLSYAPYSRSKVPEEEVQWMKEWIIEQTPPTSGSKSDDEHALTKIWQDFHEDYSKAAVRKGFIPRSISFLVNIAKSLKVIPLFKAQLSYFEIFQVRRKQFKFSIFSCKRCYFADDIRRQYEVENDPEIKKKLEKKVNDLNRHDRIFKKQRDHYFNLKDNLSQEELLITQDFTKTYTLNEKVSTLIIVRKKDP